VVPPARDPRGGPSEHQDVEVDFDDDEVASGEELVGPATIIPAYDPSKFAQESEIRERAATITDEVELEQARLASLPSNLPPPRRPMSTKPAVSDHVEATVDIDSVEEDLDALGTEEQIAILRANLAPLDRVATLSKSLGELGALLEDPRTAYVLGFVDGILPLETIVDVTGLPELETLRILDHMIDEGIVILRASRF